MIDTKELRIGNWVYNTRYKENIEIDSISSQSVNSIFMGGEEMMNTSVEDIEPIKLTPEILVKCGFEFIGVIDNKIRLPNGGPGDLHGCKEYKGYGYITVVEDNNEFKYVVYECSCDVSDDYYTITLTSLHQLQNLAFMLEDKELAISQ